MILLSAKLLEVYQKHRKITNSRAPRQHPKSAKSVSSATIRDSDNCRPLNHINHSADTGDLRAKGKHTWNFMNRLPLKGNLQESPRRPLKRSFQKQLRQEVRVCRRKHT